MFVAFITVPSALKIRRVCRGEIFFAPTLLCVGAANEKPIITQCTCAFWFDSESQRNVR